MRGQNTKPNTIDHLGIARHKAIRESRLFMRNIGSDHFGILRLFIGYFTKIEVVVVTTVDTEDISYRIGYNKKRKINYYQRLTCLGIVSRIITASNINRYQA